MGTKDFWMENLSNIFNKFQVNRLMWFSVDSVLALLLPL